MDRRAFIKLTAITGTSATLASCGHPEHQLIRFVPDEELVPGIAEWKPSVCPACAAGCGLNVRVMEADVDVTRNGERGVMKKGVAKKLEGHPLHPISQGGLCPRGQAAIQITYHPDRLTQPVKRRGARGSGDFEPVSWDEAIAALVGRLDALASAGDQKSLAFVTRRRDSRRADLVGLFLARYGAPPPIAFELFDDDVLRRANALSFGRDQLPTFDLGRARYVIAFGADFLGTWNSPVAQSRAYHEMRQGRGGARGKLVQVESRMSQTGANADEWVPIRPGTEGVLALGLAHVILSEKLIPAPSGPAGALIDGWSAGLPAYSPEEVERQTGIKAAMVTRLARELAERRPSLAIIGGAPLAQTNGLFQAVAVNALNALLGSVGQPGGVLFSPQLTMFGDAPPARGGFARFASGILSASTSPVQLLLIDDVNPVFATPRASRVRDALDKVPFVVSFASFVDETSARADLILPDHSFLESWVDARPESGAPITVASVAPPAMKPLHDTRSMPDVLLDVAKRLQKPLNPPLPWATFDAMLAEWFAKLPASAAGDAWGTAQKQAGWWGKVLEPKTAGPPPARTITQSAAQFDGDATQFPFHFLPYPSAAFLDGSLAHLPWLQELPDPVTSAMWSSWVEINPRTAERLQIAQGDLVEVRSAHGSLRAPAVVSPGIAPDVVAMPVGQGHETFTRYASGRGANPVAILAPVAEAATDTLAWAATRVTMSRAGDGRGELILFAGEMREHPHGHER